MKTLQGRRYAVAAFGLAVAIFGSALRHPAAQQKKLRLNKIVEQLEQGNQAISGQHWAFIDQEHSPYLIDKLEERFAEMARDKDSSGRPRLTPIVRIPQEADEDFRWSVKQVLDAGAYGIILPHLETKADAVRFVQAARYPPQRYTKQREPVGQRGYGPGRAAKYWGLELPEYLMRADLWPLNPDGEIFLIGLIETGLGVKNVKDILTTPGLGAILLTSGDLHMSLGVGPQMGKLAPEVEAAYQTVSKACLAQTRVFCGCMDQADNMQNRLKEGFKLYLPSSGTPYAPR